MDQHILSEHPVSDEIRVTISQCLHEIDGSTQNRASTCV
jgi:hypothetical protein